MHAWGRAVGAMLAAALLAGCSGQEADAERNSVSPSPSAVGESVTPAPQTSLASVSPGESQPGASATPEPEQDTTTWMRWGAASVDMEQALAEASQLSLKDAAGQVIMAAVSSPTPGSARRLVDDLNLGGVIVMGDAVADAEGVHQLTTAIQRGSGDQAWPVVVGVDQEGGVVARLRGLVPDLPEFMAAGAAQDKSVVRDVYAQAAVDMRALGFGVDFAPVADMTIGPADPVIRGRSPGSEVDNVSRTVVAAAAGYRDGGILPVIKHFPGHGSVTTDSHEALPTQKASLAELAERDFVPFAEAIDAGAAAVMMGHIKVPEWGSGPATLEPAAYAYLREELAFDGLIVTDALNMGAIQNGHEPGEAAVAALAAGADLLLLPPDPRAARDAIVAAVNDGKLSRERVDDAVARVITFSRVQFGLGEVADRDGNYARRLAVAGATVSAEQCGGPFVGDKVTLRGGWDSEREVLAAALRAHGIKVTDHSAAKGATVVSLSGADSDGADVVVALGAPWGIAKVEADVYVAVYGRSPDVLKGLADVLAGARAPGGDWPVTIRTPHATC